MQARGEGGGNVKIELKQTFWEWLKKEQYKAPRYREGELLIFIS